MNMKDKMYHLQRAADWGEFILSNDLNEVEVIVCLRYIHLHMAKYEGISMHEYLAKYSE